MSTRQGSLFDTDTAPAANESLFERMSAVLRGSTHPYAAKDLLKARGANKFIGRGSPASSTHRYRLAAADLANCGHYVESDVVFVSAEGARRHRWAVDEGELTLAAQAGVTFVTDSPADRARSYNVGEREVATLLLSLGYVDDGRGCWRKG